MSQDKKDLPGGGDVPAGGTPLTPEPEAPPTPDPPDAESDVDGCDIDFTKEEATTDEDLPMAEGGVA